LDELVQLRHKTLKKADTPDQSTTEHEDSNHSRDDNEFQSIIENLAKSIVHGKKPEKIREIVLKVIKYAEKQSNDFDKNEIPGTYKDLLDCIEKLSTYNFNIKPESFRDYVKGKVSKYGGDVFLFCPWPFYCAPLHLEF